MTVLRAAFVCRIPRSLLAALFLLMFGGGGLAPTQVRGEDYFRQAQALRGRFNGEFEQLAVWCDQKGLKEQAQKTRQWLGNRDPNKLYIAELPREIGRPDLPEGTPPEVAEWYDKFHEIRRRYAEELCGLARRTVLAERGERAALAFDLVLSAIRENPDNKDARRILGFQQSGGRWCSAYEADRFRKKMVWDPKYGWIRQDYVERYRKGERFLPSNGRGRGRWITAEEDARLHATIDDGWEIETEHYHIRTNHSLEAGVALGQKLEGLYRVWKELFFPFFARPGEVRAVFSGQGRSAPPQKYRVVYFRNVHEFRRALKPLIPNVDKTIGIYTEVPPAWDANARGAAYFYHGDDSDERTMYHEATHQLFHESRKNAPHVGAQANFWIVEGAALYMETLRRADGFYVLGGFDDIRLKAAEYHLATGDYYVPFADLAAMGMVRLQNEPQIISLYSQMAGMALFLMHYDGGRYRDAMINYLGSVYSGNDDVATLSTLTGTRFNTLDAQYREFLLPGKAGGAAKVPQAKQ
jgi:hypothetical protein